MPHQAAPEEGNLWPLAAPMFLPGVLGQGYPEEGDLANFGAMRLTHGLAPPTQRDSDVEELGQVLHKVMDMRGLLMERGRAATSHKEGDPRAGKKARDSLLPAQDSSLPGMLAELLAWGDHRGRGP